MKHSLRFQVFTTSDVSQKPVFERIVYMDSSLTVDFDKLFYSLRAFYGINCVIVVSSELV